MGRFTGKVALVTGAGSGIGAATARRLAEEGAAIILADRDEGSATDGADALVAAGHDALAVTLDVADSRSVGHLAGLVTERFGRLDALVNNAGIHFGGAFAETDRGHWRRLFAVNVDGVMEVSLALLPLLRLAGGAAAIVNVSSISGLGGDFGQAAYATSKGAITHLTRSMALDLAADGIRVNAVCPGSVRTPMFEAAIAKLDGAKVEETFARAYPMGRIAEPREVAAVIAFLASEDASFVTGVNLPVDGGLTAHNGAPRFDGA